MTATPRKLEPEVSNGQPWVLPVFALLCWGLAVRHLSLEWSLNEQYHYGWLVPLLALYLLRLRLETMPAAGPVRSSWIVGWGVLIIAAAEALLIPLREANADWRLLGAVLTGLAALATLLAFFHPPETDLVDFGAHLAATAALILFMTTAGRGALARS